MGMWITENLRYIFDSLLSLIYSGNDYCAACGSELNDCTQKSDEQSPFYAFLCEKCRKTVDICSEVKHMQRGKTSVDAYSAVYYSFAVKELILKLKYQNNFNAGEVLGDLMIKALNRDKIDFDYVTFVPSGQSAMKKRGYNQSRMLALTISRKFRVPLVDCIYKAKETKDQIGLGGYMRWYNLKGNFKIKRINKIKNKKILLVDDVITTGATAFYCSEALIQNGSGKVTVLTAARSTV